MHAEARWCRAYAGRIRFVQYVCVLTRKRNGAFLAFAGLDDCARPARGMPPLLAAARYARTGGSMRIDVQVRSTTQRTRSQRQLLREAGNVSSCAGRQSASIGPSPSNDRPLRVRPILRKSTALLQKHARTARYAGRSELGAPRRQPA
jgi:hypothetical protein